MFGLRFPSYSQLLIHCNLQDSNSDMHFFLFVCILCYLLSMLIVSCSSFGGY